MRFIVAISAVLALAISAATTGAEEPLLAGFAAVDITPSLDKGQRVYLAGYGTNRRAAGVHDPLYARTAVFRHGGKQIAIVSVDLIGLQYPATKAIRAKLPEFNYVLVSSTHNHQGPDVIGIWGKGPFHRGADDAYIDRVVDQIVESVQNATQTLAPVTARFGTAEDGELLADTRLPDCRDGVVRVVRLNRLGTTAAAGLLVQWNCHPESLGPGNKLITADFPYATIASLEKAHQCPVVYLSGAVGGLMTNPAQMIRGDSPPIPDRTYEFAEHYGQAVAQLANKALTTTESLSLTPFAIHATPISVPVHNGLYRIARVIGVMKRDIFVWSGDYAIIGNPMTEQAADQPGAIETEVAYLRLGELHVGGIPGEIYPELVYGKFEEPAAENVDFPEAPLEPTIAQLMPSNKWLLIGLANDELGYIIPKRQWDKSPPYAYGKDGGQYGEINSCGPEVAPIIMEALKQRIADAK